MLISAATELWICQTVHFFVVEAEIISRFPNVPQGGYCFS
jgi:hypothetical protein